MNRLLLAIATRAIVIFRQLAVNENASVDRETVGVGNTASQIVDSSIFSFAFASFPY